MPNVTGTMILSILKGIAKVPQDTLSAERGVDGLSLLDPNGFSCDEYLMKLPTMKSSAVYADSPLTDGRQLISGVLGNVNEIIRLTLTSSTIVQMAAQLSKLGQLKQDCRDFWSTFGQIEPVFIKHQIDGEPGPRHALLYDIDIDIETPIDPSVPMRTITINIEREFAWRGLPPGGNPKRWTIENFFVGQAFRPSNAPLLSGGDHVISQTIQNRSELTPDGSWWRQLTQNFVDIPATSIPGDLPALVCISIYPPVSTNITSVFVAKSTKYITGNSVRTSIGLGITNANRFPVTTLNAADGNAVTDTTIATDVGAPKNATTGTNQRSATAFVTTSLAERLSWSNNNVGLSLGQMRGRYACFLRCRLSAAGTVGVQLNVRQGTTSANTLSLTTVTTTDAGGGGTGTTTDWGVLYLGQVTVPISDKRTDSGANGLGILMDGGNGLDLTFSVYASRVSGTPVFYMSDLILLPIDEGALQITAPSAQTIGSSSATVAAVYDNTGYYKHGDPGDYAAIISNTSNASNDPLGEREAATGAILPIYLTPNANNRLVFFAMVDATKRSQISDPSAMNVRVDIIPRWSGLRDK
jgi:hypothetical protein